MIIAGAAASGFQRLDGSENLPKRLRGGVVAIGNFDGVHRGHQAVLERALAEAARLRAPALMLTFEPHPRKFFRPDHKLPRLTPAPMKAHLAKALGLDAVVETTFSAGFAALSAEAFVETILMRNIGIAHAVTGFDFHFGKGRQGGPAFLMAAGERLGFGVTLVDAFRDEGAEIVSSSRIRTLLAEGDLAEANGLLGYRHTVEAAVIGGQKLGRTLGFPTANMALGEDANIADGVYAVRLRRPDGALHDGVASFGRRPTVNSDGEPLLETYVFDFAGDLYGETCRISLFARLRGEEKFDGLDPLVAQMRRDEAEARAMLVSVAPLSPLDATIAFT